MRTEVTIRQGTSSAVENALSVPSAVKTAQNMYQLLGFNRQAGLLPLPK